MNMFYSGLGIARSLGENGIPVIGLTSQRGIYGNFTRYAKVCFCPDSKDDPERLSSFLISLGRSFAERGVIFPTRDADLLFLDRFRNVLEPYFHLAIPESPVLDACLNKWETYQGALRAGVPSPKCWLVESREQLDAMAHELAYPCVLKPVVAQDWRAGGNWGIVGGRKAILVSSEEELVAEYTVASRAQRRAMVQEVVPGGDEYLVIMACYLDQESKWVAGFNTQKLVQIPPGFGTGCIVQAADRPELIAPTMRLLSELRYSGIAEVEYKWNNRKQEYELIEINPRPWDQHRLGKGCGVDLVHIAYCDYAGLPRPALRNQQSAQKWIAEDTFVIAALRLLWARDSNLLRLLRLARGSVSMQSGLCGIRFLFLATYLPGSFLH